MAVGTYTLPICDGCKLPWLPVGWTQDSDPRHLREGAKPLRCGKCKSIGWDREFVKQQKIAVDVVQPMELDVDPAAEKISAGPIREEEVDMPISEVLYEALIGIPADADVPPRVWPTYGGIERGSGPGTNRNRCKHRMTECPICHPKEAA